MATQLWLFLTIWREYKASISPISILITWNLEIMLDSCKITTKLLWKCFKMLKWGEMRHMNDQYCPKVLLYGCIKLFVPQYDFFMTKIILYWFFYLFLRQQKLQLQCVHHRFFDYGKLRQKFLIAHWHLKKKSPVKIFFSYTHWPVTGQTLREHFWKSYILTLNEPQDKILISKEIRWYKL